MRCSRRILEEAQGGGWDLLRAIAANTGKSEAEVLDGLAALARRECGADRPFTPPAGSPEKSRNRA